MKLRGKVSWFGGPEDTGVSPSEALAFIYRVEDAPHLFLLTQPPGTTGLARRLDPEVFYCATRWDYSLTPKDVLPSMLVEVRSPKTGKAFMAWPADWGPHQDTGRVADISKGLMQALGIQTDDEVEVSYQVAAAVKIMPYERIIISSGHGKYVRGAAGSPIPPCLDEVDEARKVVQRLADELEARGVEVITYHDDVSKSQNENLNRIVDFHNSKTRDLDVSVHFNAYNQAAHGTEVLYITQSTLASQVSAAIAACGFTNRGGKKRTDLFFLNNTSAPAILIETCFCDNSADSSLYRDKFDDICAAIADVLGGEEEEIVEPPPVEPPPVEVTTSRVDIKISGNVVLFVNGQQILIPP